MEHWKNLIKKLEEKKETNERLYKYCKEYGVEEGTEIDLSIQQYIMTHDYKKIINWEK